MERVWERERIEPDSSLSLTEKDSKPLKQINALEIPYTESYATENDNLKIKISDQAQREEKRGGDSNGKN